MSKRPPVVITFTSPGNQDNWVYKRFMETPERATQFFPQPEAKQSMALIRTWFDGETFRQENIQPEEYYKRMTLPTLAQIADSIEAGASGRGIDAEIWLILRSDEEYAKALGRVQQPCGCPNPHSEVISWAKMGWFSPYYTTSLDACSSLGERVLPHSAISSGKSTAHDGKYWSTITRPVTDAAGTWTRRESNVEASTECAARLAAILRAVART
mgnify:FL=1